MILLLQILSWG